MEQQKEKKRNVCEREITQSKSASSIPLDLTSEKLLRLPEKSVARFRCVSKLWLSITTAPDFIDLFEARSPRPSLLLCFKEKSKLFVSSIPKHSHTLRNSKISLFSSQPLDCYHMKLSEEYDNFSWPTESVHGLICFQKSATPIVWNPSTRQFLTLPKPRMSWNRLTVFLGYDPTEGKHKVMCIPFGRISDVCEVLTIGSAQESWRTVKTKHMHSSYNQTYGRCINGVVYYIANSYNNSTSAWVLNLMRFDVRSEKFDWIQLPPDTYMSPLITYEERLACFKKNTTEDGKNTNGITLCILEDAEKRKWSSKGFRAPLFHQDKISNTYMTVKGITPAGEFIYLPYTFGKSPYILFCDPVRMSYRRFELTEIADEMYTHNVFLYP